MTVCFGEFTIVPFQEDAAILGVVEVGKGRIGVYGDSNCLDSSHMVDDCFWLLQKMLDFTSENIKDPVLFSKSFKQKQPLDHDENRVPSRRTDLNFSMYSGVIGKELVCGNDSRFDVWGTKGYGLDVGLPRHQGIDLNPTSDFNRTRGFYLKSLVVFPSRWIVLCVVAVFGE